MTRSTSINHLATSSGAICSEYCMLVASSSVLFAVGIVLLELDDVDVDVEVDVDVDVDAEVEVDVEVEEAMLASSISISSSPGSQPSGTTCTSHGLTKLSLGSSEGWSQSTCNDSQGLSGKARSLGRCAITVPWYQSDGGYNMRMCLPTS